MNENEIIIDLEELKKQNEEGTLNENLLRIYGVQLELILKQMFGIPIFGPNAYVKGKPKDLKALAAALGSERKYIESAKKFGLNNPKTYKSRSTLERATRGFEKVTGIKWPFK
tara:strand:- start:280 stop:618 length:339 start_codon:yes stop_codon:yes gene_type:complete